MFPAGSKRLTTRSISAAGCPTNDPGGPTCGRWGGGRGRDLGAGSVVMLITDSGNRRRLGQHWGTDLSRVAGWGVACRPPALVSQNGTEISQTAPIPPVRPSCQPGASQPSHHGERWWGCPDCPAANWPLRRSRGQGPFHVLLFVAQLVLACPDQEPPTTFRPTAGSPRYMLGVACIRQPIPPT